MNNKEPFEQALAAIPQFPEEAAQGAYKKVRRRIVVKNIMGFSSAAGVLAMLVLATGSFWMPPKPLAPSAEIVEELQYVHDCVWGSDSETDLQYASAY